MYCSLKIYDLHDNLDGSQETWTDTLWNSYVWIIDKQAI